MRTYTFSGKLYTTEVTLLRSICWYGCFRLWIWVPAAAAMMIGKRVVDKSRLMGGYIPRVYY